ncbi:MAG: phosphoglucosamine mutase, partial [Candidatus Aminicenantes bacterium]|nr:phosphoglucosamine mutase [Candidatus Aminicenantes bacterium]
AVLGGEQSGHIIYRTMQKTGDGIITSLLFLKALEFLKLSVSEASELYKPFPQIIKSIKIREKRPLDSWEELNIMTGNFNKEYGDNSRILIRYSGTEKKIRLMIESEDENVINKNLEIFEDFLISEIGEDK